MRIRGIIPTLAVATTVVAGLTVGTASAHAASSPSTLAPPHAGNAPQCIETSAWGDGIYDYQSAYNACDQAWRVKLVWAVASGDCQTLEPGQSMTCWVFKPAWANGADLC
jgi:hypothetical protein